jgi:curved DNA-binding protein CbpA
MNPYDVLGVPKDADEAAVKKAFRRKARESHPDRAGGSGERMALVNRAYDVLSDPARRQQYDDTGDTGPINSVEQEATGLAGAIFGEAIEQDQVSIVAFAKQKARDISDGLKRQRSEALVKIARFERKSNKVRRKTKGAPNMVQAAIEQQLTRYRSLVKEADRKLEVTTAAIRLIEDYDEDNPTPPGMASATMFLNGHVRF